MLSEWALRGVDDVRSERTGGLATGPFGSSVSSKFFMDEGVPLIRGSNLSEAVSDRLVEKDFVFVSEDKANEFPRAIARRGDLIFTCWGTITQVGLIDERSRFERYLISNKQMKLSPDPGKADSLFLYYLFSSPAMQAEIRGVGIGSSVPGFNLGQLRSLQFPLPSVSEQRAIAAVLGSLDDKIEQNRRTSAALEKLARSIFRAWFVDFEPVKAKAAGAKGFPSMPPEVFAALPTTFVDSELGPIPDGWEVKRVAELEKSGTILIGDGYRAKRAELADQGLPFIRAGNVNGVVDVSGAELLGITAVQRAGVKRSQVWDTVFTSKGTVGRIGLVTPGIGEVVYAPQVCFWRSVNPHELSSFFLHLWMKSSQFTDQWMGVKGQTDMADFVSLSDQRAMQILIPPSTLRAAICTIAEPTIQSKAYLEAESRKLAELRDYLLPKLLSGQVRVRAAERAVEEVA